MSNLVIVSGCWQHQQQDIQIECMQNICHAIDSMQNCAAVILSANHARLDTSHHDRIWCDTERRYFFSEQGITWMRDSYLCELERRQQYSNSVNLSISNHGFCGPELVAASLQWQLWYLLEHVYTQVDTVWYFGIGWNLGVRRDPIGWGHLLDLCRHHQITRPIAIKTRRQCTLVNVDVFGTTHEHSRFTWPEFDRDWTAQTQDVFVCADIDWQPEDRTCAVPGLYWPNQNAN